MKPKIEISDIFEERFTRFGFLYKEGSIRKEKGIGAPRVISYHYLGKSESGYCYMSKALLPQTSYKYQDRWLKRMKILK